MAKHYDKWARRQGLEAYRIYDADLEEHPLTVDRYGDKLYVAVYAARGQDLSDSDWQDLRQAYRETLIETLGVGRDDLFFKLRQSSRGGQQYDKLAWVEREFPVSEYGVRFLVNLTDYLDTGLFLDHRQTRKMVGDQARGRRVLNLFAYTCAFSVHAAVGGAAEVTSVDLSNTYLEWGKRNFVANGLDPDAHQFIRADVKAWLKNGGDGSSYDLVVLDPPTFSNSKAMNDVLDLQRDHGELIENCWRLLRPGGTLYFSTNNRRFRLDADKFAEDVTSREITKQTVPPDFRKRNPHRCWTFQKG